MCAAGGGDVKIESHKVSFREKAQPKIGSLDNVSHSPGGGNIKVRLSHVKTSSSLCSVHTANLSIICELLFSHPCSLEGNFLKLGSVCLLSTHFMNQPITMRIY